MVQTASTDADDRSTDLSMISQYMLEGLSHKAGTPDQGRRFGVCSFKLKAKPGLHGNFVIRYTKWTF